MPKPTICQIHGAALGGAFELALACDFRVMAEDAVAGIMEVRVGLLPDVGGCSRLPAVVGLGNAKELISYAVYDVRSKEDAVEWTNRFLRLHAELWPGWEGEADVLKVFGPEDFAPPSGDSA